MAVSRAWRCPHCGVTLIAVEDGRTVVIRYRGKTVTKCPQCKTKRINQTYRETRRDV